MGGGSKCVGWKRIDIKMVCGRFYIIYAEISFFIEW